MFLAFSVVCLLFDMLFPGSLMIFHVVVRIRFVSEEFLFMIHERLLESPNSREVVREYPTSRLRRSQTVPVATCAALGRVSGKKQAFCGWGMGDGWMFALFLARRLDCLENQKRLPTNPNITLKLRQFSFVKRKCVRVLVSFPLPPSKLHLATPMFLLWGRKNIITNQLHLCLWSFLGNNDLEKPQQTSHQLSPS